MNFDPISMNTHTHHKNFLAHWIYPIGFIIASLIIITARDTPLFNNIPVVCFLPKTFQQVVIKSKAETLNYFLPDFNRLGPILEKPGRFSVTDYEPYIKYYERAIDLFPEASDAYAMLGLLYYYSGKQEDSITAFKTARQNRPSFWASYNLGLIFWSQNKYKHSAMYFKEALELPPAPILESMLASRVYKQFSISRISNLPERLSQDIGKASIYFGLCLNELNHTKQSQTILRNFTQDEVLRLKSQPITLRVF
jgi:tetratricopeptide (TPR) repeat protein